MLFVVFSAHAQEERYLIDKNVPAEYYDLATKIDKGFEPTSNFIQSIVFYSFKIKNN